MKKDTQQTEGALQRFPVLVLISALAITPVALPLTRSAFAQDRPCLADAQRLCNDLTPDDRDGMMQCLADTQLIEDELRRRDLLYAVNNSALFESLQQ